MYVHNAVNFELEVYSLCMSTAEAHLGLLNGSMTLDSTGM